MLVRETGGNEAAGGDAVRCATIGFDRRFGGGGGISCTLSSVSVSYHLDRLRDAGEGEFIAVSEFENATRNEFRPFQRLV